MSDFIRKFQDSPSSAAGFFSTPLYFGSNIPDGNPPQEAASGSVQSCLNGSEELFSQSLFATNGTPNDAKHLISNENSIPLNLFQDSCDLKLSTLPDHVKKTLEDLINKINYQINYFSLDNKTQSKKVKLTCKLCCVTLRIAKVEKHVLDQEHLRNLTKRCKSSKKTSATAAVSKKIWDFLDFEESSQCYRCTLCNMNLPESRNSWNKHFQSGSHGLKLKALKPENASNPISASSSASGSKRSSTSSLTNSRKKVGSDKPNNVSLSSTQSELNKNSFDVVTQFLSDQDKKVLKAVKQELRDKINYFEPSFESGSGKLYLFCKVCRVAILLKNVRPHVSTDEHGKNLKKDSSFLTCTTAQHGDNAKLSVSQSSAQIKAYKKFSATTELLTSGRSEKAVQDLKHKLKDYMNYFEPSHENGSNKPQFTCKICNIALPSKNARLHIFSETHLNNLRENVRVLNHGLHGWPMQILHDIVSQFHNKLYFFQVIYDTNSNGIYFVCQVCTLVLIPEDVKNHIYSCEHLENVRANPMVLQFDSLNDRNKQIVREMAAAVKDRVRDFTFVYRIGTDELRFYCKYCQLTLIPQKVENHAKTSDHLKAVSAQSNQTENATDKINSQKQSLKNDAQSNATISPKTVLNSVHPPKTQNSNILDSFADIEKKFIETFKDDSNYKYFELLHSVDSNKFYFKCRLCDVTVKPTHVTNHIQVGYHLKNTTLSSYFKNFQWLKESSKKIVRRLFYEAGDKLNGFSLLPDAGDKKPQFLCKLCNVTISSDFVVNHLHQKCGKEEKSAKCTNLRTSVQPYEPKSNLDSEPMIHETVENITPVFKPVGVYVSPAFSNLRKSTNTLSCESVRSPIQSIVTKHTNKILEAKVSHQTSSNKCSFVCQDCNTVIHCTPFQNNGLFKETREKLFCNCCEKSAETALLNLKSRKAAKNNALNSETVLPESEVNALNSSNKEILKTLIDKIGLKISNFDFVLKNSSDELRFKCKFCSVMMRSETVGDHLNSQEHVKYSQLSDLSDLRFESLNNRNKKLVRKLFNKVGREINDFDVTLCFVCKICGVNLNTTSFSPYIDLETVVSHLKSKEHLKHLMGHSSRDGMATDLCDAKTSQDRDDGFVNVNKNWAQETFNPSDAHGSVPLELCQSANDFSVKLAKSCDGVVERTSSDTVSQTSGNTNLISSTAKGKLRMASKVSKTVLPPSLAENNYLHRKAQENSVVSQADECATAVNTNETSHVLRSPVSNNDLISSARDQSHLHVSSTQKPLFSPQSPSVQKSSFLEGGKHLSRKMESETKIKIESKESTTQPKESSLVPGLITSESSESYLCFVCQVYISSKDIGNHVSSEGHTISLTSPYSINFKAFQSYYRDLVKMFTGYLSNGTNKYEILYEVPENKLRFYCKLCSLMLRAEFLENHVNREHLSNSPHNQNKANCYSLAAESGSQPFKKFLCEPCNSYVCFKDVANHVSSVAHSVSLLRVRKFLKFSSFFTYKDRVLETLVHSKSKKTSDFEFFSESYLPKLHVYCKPCELLLQPEYLDPHVGLPQHSLNSTIMEQWDEAYGPYRRSFYASKEEISNMKTSTDWCSIM